MATITLTIPDGVLTRVLDAIALRHGYDPLTDGTKAQFAKAVVLKWVKKEVVEQEAGTVAAAASATQTTASNTEITLS